jgi:hypothetical protein
MTTTNHPAGVITLLNQVRDLTRNVKGIHVEAYARGVLVTTRPNDTEGASRISKAHAALRASTTVAPSHIIRQAPTVLKIVAPRTNRTRKARKNI